MLFRMRWTSLLMLDLLSVDLWAGGGYRSLLSLRWVGGVLTTQVAYVLIVSSLLSV